VTEHITENVTEHITEHVTERTTGATDSALTEPGVRIPALPIVAHGLFGTRELGGVPLSTSALVP